MSGSAAGTVAGPSVTRSVWLRCVAAIAVVALLAPAFPSASFGRSSAAPGARPPALASRAPVEERTAALDAGEPPSLVAQWSQLQLLALGGTHSDSDVAIQGGLDPDGLADSVEDVLGLDPGLADTDGDTIRDGIELWLGLDPTEADTNADGLPDNAELQGAATIRPIGDLAGTWASAVALNDAGQVVIERRTDPGTQTILWTAGAATPLPAEVAYATAVNNRSQLVGKTTGGDAFVWTEDDGVTLIVPAWGDAEAAGINDAGEVAGTASVNDSTLPQAWLWADGEITWLGRLTGGSASSATGLNELGQVVGSSETAGYVAHAFIWPDAAGKMRDLGTLGGATSVANAVNDRGRVVGNSETADGEFHAFVWDAAGGMQDLGTLGGSYSTALAVNEAGQVVGGSETANGAYHAFLYDDGTMVDLGAIDPDSLSEAVAISDLGVIVGFDQPAGTEPQPGLRRPVALGVAGSDAVHLAYATSTDDNDGDGLPDAVDVAPYAASAFTDTMTIDLTTTGNPTYLDFQVVPERSDRLSLFMAGLDWLDGDAAGSMQDRDASQQDVGIAPYLEIDVNDRSVFETPPFLDLRSLDGFDRLVQPGSGLGNTPAGQAWTQADTWWTDSSSAYAHPAYGPKLAMLDLDATSGYVQAELRPNEMGPYGEGLAYRVRDSSNYEYVNATSAGLEVGSVVAGTRTTLGSFPITWSWDRLLRVEFVGATVRVLWRPAAVDEAAWTLVAEVDRPEVDRRATGVGLYLPAYCVGCYLMDAYGAWDDFEAGALTTVLDKYGVIAPWQPPDTTSDEMVRAEYSDFDGDGAADDLRLWASQHDPLDEILEVVAGEQHTCARTADGDMWCWGDNTTAQLGTGAPGPYKSGATDNQQAPLSESWPDGMRDPAAEPYPVGPHEALHDVAAIGAGTDHTCAIAGGDPDVPAPDLLYCWGANAHGQARVSGAPTDWCAPDRTATSLTPGCDPTAYFLAPSIIVAGEGHTCYATPYNGLWCRGLNTSGQLGRGDTTSGTAWVKVAQLQELVKVPDVGMQLQTKPFTLDRTVTPPFGSTSLAVAAGRTHSCAIVNVHPTGALSGRRVACWGANESSQVAPPTVTDEDVVATPRAMSLAGSAVPAWIAVGARHSCVLTTTGGVQCWGANEHGQAGGSASAWVAPHPVVLPLDAAHGERATDVAAGDEHSCAITSTGRALCWGGNDLGQLGSGTAGEWTRDAAASPIALPSDTAVAFVDVVAGADHACALTDGGQLWCWGANGRGQLGNATLASWATPALVGWRQTVMTTGYDVQLTGDGQAAAARWTPLEPGGWTEPSISGGFPSPLPGFGEGVTAPRAIPMFISGDGRQTIFVWGTDRASGELRYTFGFEELTWWCPGDGDGYGFSEAQAGGSMDLGADGTAVTIGNFDGTPGLDVLRVEVDDLENHAIRARIAGNFSAASAYHYEGGSCTWQRTVSGPTWRPQTAELRDTAVGSRLYVPLTPVRTATGTPAAFGGRLLLPDSVPAGEFEATARLVWMVTGRTDDPERAAAAGRSGENNLPIQLATYADGDRFSLAGFKASEHVRVETGVYSPAVTGEKTRWTQLAQAASLLTQRWLHGTGDGPELWLSCNPTRPEQQSGCGSLPDALAATDLSLASESAAFAHDDEAAVGTELLVSKVLASVPVGSAVPVLFAVERQGRTVALDDLDHASVADGSIDIDLASAPDITVKSFETNYYDTTGPQPVPLGGRIVDLLEGWDLDPKLAAALGTLLLAWDAGETTIASIDGSLVPRAGNGNEQAQAFNDLMDSSWWDLTNLGMALDAVDGLVEVVQYFKASEPAVRSVGEASRDLAVTRVKSSIVDVDAARLASKASELGTTARKVGKVLGWVEHAGTSIDVAVMGLSFLATAMSGTYGSYTTATVYLALDITLFLVEYLAVWAMTSYMVSIGIASGPAGWVALGVIVLITAYLLVLDYVLGVDWYGEVKDAIWPLRDNELAKLDTNFVNVRTVLEDGDGNGLDVGDAVGLAADFFGAEFPVGPVSPGGGFGGTGTQLGDMTRTFVTAGLKAVSTEAIAQRSDTPKASQWPVWPGHTPLQAWVVPSGPDTDFVVTYQVESEASVAWLECITFQGCDHLQRSPEDSVKDVVTMHYDVLPAGLDALLAWRLPDQRRVVTRLDRDADGLDDADDAWPDDADHDDDGLLDGLEVNAFDTSPSADDTDADGLADSREIVIGTRATDQDSDGDDAVDEAWSLSDGAEVTGWPVTITFEGAQVDAWVTSDPRLLDTDADGLPDGQERVLGLNPRSADTDGDGFADAPDVDADGVSDAIEDAAPNGGDGNGDGTDDADQDNVTSLPDAIDRTFLTVESPAGTTLADVATTTQPAGAPGRLTLPHGVVGFTVQDATNAAVKLYFPFDSSLNAYWKYGPTADNPADHWYKFKYDGTTGAQIGAVVIDGTPLTVVTLHLVDGARGDADLTGNGEIVDPGGLGEWLNEPPVAVADTTTTTEDTSIVVGVLANDTDPDGDLLTLQSVDPAATGTVTPNADGTVTYDPAGAFEGLRPGQTATDTFGYTADDGYEGTATATVTVTVTGVDDAPAWLSTPDGTGQYSDGIAPIRITARDVDSDAVAMSASGLPAGLSLGDVSCAEWTTGSECSATIAGSATAPAGEYPVSLAAWSDEQARVGATLTITVGPEDSTVRFAGGNDVAVPVASTGGASGAFELTVRLSEALPDAATGLPSPGDPGLAHVTVQLVPVGAGGTVVPAGACATRVAGTGYDAELTVTCPFDGVPVNTYAVEATVDGGFYAGGGTDVLVVYDPSLGYTTGGGSFTWPDTEDVVSFGYTMEYNRKGESLKGALLLVRHTVSGDYEVRSNALYGLALGDATASFSGKATYLEPGWLSRVGNHEFTMYVVDNGPADAGLDRAWIEVRDKVRLPIPAMSMPMPGVDHAVVLDDGDVFAPAKGD